MRREETINQIIFARSARAPLLSLEIVSVEDRLKKELLMMQSLESMRLSCCFTAYKSGNPLREMITSELYHSERVHSNRIDHWWYPGRKLIDTRQRITMTTLYSLPDRWLWTRSSLPQRLRRSSDSSLFLLLLYWILDKKNSLLVSVLKYKHYFNLLGCTSMVTLITYLCCTCFHIW